MRSTTKTTLASAKIAATFIQKTSNIFAQKTPFKLYLPFPESSPYFVHEGDVLLHIRGEEVHGPVSPRRGARHDDAVLAQDPEVVLDGLVVEAELLPNLVGVEGLFLDELHYLESVES